jgi:hypothetical protein
VEEARREDCRELTLDSGVQRVDAHRFYLDEAHGDHVAPLRPKARCSAAARLTSRKSIYRVQAPLSAARRVKTIPRRF